MKFMSQTTGLFFVLMSLVSAAQATSFNGIYQLEPRDQINCANAFVIGRNYSQEDSSSGPSEDQTLIAYGSDLRKDDGDQWSSKTRTDFGVFRSLYGTLVFNNPGKCSNQSDVKLGLGLTTQWSNHCITSETENQMIAQIKRSAAPWIVDGRDTTYFEIDRTQDPRIFQITYSENAHRKACQYVLVQKN